MTSPVAGAPPGWLCAAPAWAAARAVTVALRGELVLLQPPRPPHWGGYRLKPDNWQFWQGRKSRLHDRLRYRLAATGPDTGWVRERLAP